MFPNKKESIVLTLSLILVQLLIGVYLSIAGVRWETGNPTIYIIVAISSTSVIVFVSLSRMKLKFKQLFHAEFNNLGSLLIITVIPTMLVAFGAQILLSNYFNLYYTLFPVETVFTKNINALMGSGLLGFLSVCLIAPIVEEIVFRGIVLRGLLGSYRREYAIFFSSVLFSLYHINPEQLLHALLIGYFFGWLYVRTYSLWPSIAAHMIFNFIAFILNDSYIQLEGVNYFPGDELVYPAIPLQLCGVGSLFVGFFLLNRILIERNIL